MGGLRKIAKLYGRITINGVRYVWDYACDEPILETDMPVGSDRWKTSEKVRYTQIKESRK